MRRELLFFTTLLLLYQVNGSMLCIDCEKAPDAQIALGRRNSTYKRHEYYPWDDEIGLLPPLYGHV